MLPRVSVCIPTYRRPDMLERAIRSVMSAPADILEQVELLVCDNSPDDESKPMVERLFADHPGPSRYHRNVPDVGMVGNHNKCVELSTGRHVQILHDDDYFLPGGTERLVQTVTEHDAPTLVFGVDVVDAKGKLLADRGHDAFEAVQPDEAVRRLLGRSSYIRFPAMVVRRDVYEELGAFEDDLAGAEDLEIWVRFAAVHGLLLVPRKTAAYVIHPDADTELMFTLPTIQKVNVVFDRARANGTLSAAEVDKCQADFLHQFALGGAWRALRAGDRGRAKERIGMLKHPDVSKYGRSIRWTPVQIAMRVLTVGAKVPTD